MKQRIVLGYSGDLVTTVAVRWLADVYAADVVALTLDLGQRRDPAEVRERAMAAGAVRAHVLDVREEFARDCILPHLQSDPSGADPYPPVSMLAVPLVGRKLVEIAAVENAAAIAHGSTAAAIDAAARAVRPDVTIIAPARDWNMTAAELAGWARRHDVPSVPDGPYDVEENLWGRAVSWIDGESPAPPHGVRPLAAPGQVPPDSEAFVDITFEQGTPVAVNGVPMPLTELIESVSVIAGQHGVGRAEQVHTDAAGRVRWTVYERPAAVVLQAAYASRHHDTATVRLRISGGQTVVSPLVSHA